MTTETTNRGAGQILVVAPREGLVMSDETLHALAFELLGVERKSPTVRTLRRVMDLLPAGQALRGASVLLPETTRRKLLIPSELEDSRTLVVEILRAVLARDLSGVIPGARVVALGSPELDGLECVGGVFAPGVAYAVHPVDPRTYLLVSRFHEYLLEEKRSEFLALASALGASELTLVDDASEQMEAELHAGVQVPADAQLGVKASGSSASAKSFNLSARFGRPVQPIRLPDRTRWLNAEPMWQRMAEARLQGNVEELTVGFSYDAEFGVSASIAASLEGVGIGIGGRYSSRQSLRQAYRLTFYPRSECPV